MTKSEILIPSDKEIKRGMVVLYITQIFGTLSYSILYSTLTLFAKDKLALSTTQVFALTGSFLAFNFGLHFLGGYMGGRCISNRLLFIIGMAFQALGCAILYQANYTSLMIGLAVFLTGSGLNVTCMNSMVTQLFTDPDDTRREKAFLWNYSGMNIGFFIGFTIAGAFQFSQDYGTLFALGGLANVIAILLIVFNWHTVRDRETYLTAILHTYGRVKQYFKAAAIIIITLIVMLVLMRHSEISNIALVIIAIAMIIVSFGLGFSIKTIRAKGRMLAFCIFLIANMIFWTVYQLVPVSLTLFMVHNVKMEIFGWAVTPQWTDNINAVIIIFGGPFMAFLLSYIRKKKGIDIPLPFLFALAVVLIGIGIASQSLGIMLADKNGYVAFGWIITFFVFQSVGELCISPIGYAAVGKLVPRKLQNLMMGLWCMMTGVAAIFSSQISILAVGNGNLSNPIVTDPGYLKTYGIIGAITLIVGVILFILYPKFNRMINESDEKATAS